MTRSARVTAASILFGLLLTASPTRAQEVDPGFWRSVREPGYDRAIHLARQGVHLLDVHAQHARDQTSGPHELNAILEGAIERFALAHRLAPNEPAILFMHASSLARWEQPGAAHGESRMDDEALSVFEELRALDSTYLADKVAFAIGVIHTRAHRFAEAAEEYRIAISRAIEPDAVYWSNLAEVTMLAGDVEEAVRVFERSTEIADQTGQEKTLALWGLAVALDRVGEHRRALEIADDALTNGGDSMSILRHEDVFYEPPYELHWYEGLGHAAMARRAEDRESRERREARSRESFRRFLAEGGTESPWAALAQRHADEGLTVR
jgi:tetratricopeptide (TPR) repeat protein